MRKRIAILGSTGSIGRSALDVVRHYPDRFEVASLAAHSNIDLLAAQIAEFSPTTVAVADEDAGRKLAADIPGLDILTGFSGLAEIAAMPADVILCAVVGAAGLTPLLHAIDAGNPIALANKEPFVMAGPMIVEQARRRGVAVVPVDSEHSAIFQCLHGHDPNHVQCIHLTASGGPFYGRRRESLRGVIPEEAADHPTWDMGPKISVDSATLMNKGLEVIEAMYLFNVPVDKVEVVIHPQSIVHGLVEFTDGSILAQLGPTDMKFPIVFALSWPERVQSPMGRLDLTQMRELAFAEPDFSEFPCLDYAYQAARTGGTAGAVLNAANEAAVTAFCKHRIAFLDISEVVGEVLDKCPIESEVTLDSVLASDTEARRRANDVINRLGTKQSCSST